VGDPLLVRREKSSIVSRLSRILGVAMLLAAFSGASRADQFVIANPSVNVADDEIREVYLGEKQFAGAQKLLPVDNTAVQGLFLSRVLRMTAAKYETAWIKKSFREGLAIPQVRSSNIETIEFVRRTPGAVGYITADKPPTGVVVVTKF
jgi:hypothetical protein